MERLESAYFLWMVMIVPLLVIIHALNSAWRRRIKQRLGGEKSLAVLMPDRSEGRKVIKLLLVSLAISALAIALANPQSGSSIETMEREGIDVVFALDVSRSMLAEDSPPDRLSLAKQVVSATLDEMGSNRIGLIGYAGQAIPQLPLTTDLASARLFLDNMDTEMVGVQGTAIADALELAVNMFDYEVDHSRAIVLLTDGEDHEGNLEGILKECEELDIHIYTLGVGTERGGPIPIKDNYGRRLGYKEDKDGNKVITQLNKEALKGMASATRGKYLDVISSKRTVRDLLSHFQQLDTSEFESQMYTDYEDQYYWFVGLALFFILLDTFLLERKTRWLERWLQ
jgi:Ca-activated chloride channel family protein